MSRPSYPPQLDHSNYVWCILQVMKLLTVNFSQDFCHFPLR
jgi:hypothetical protein